MLNLFPIKIVLGIKQGSIEDDKFLWPNTNVTSNLFLLV